MKAFVSLVFVISSFVGGSALAAPLDLPPSPAEVAQGCADNRVKIEREAASTAGLIAKQKKTSVTLIQRFERRGDDGCGGEFYRMHFADGLKCFPLVTLMYDVINKKRTAVTMAALNCSYSKTAEP